MGGGFGGCTINLIKKGHEDRIKEQFRLYSETFGIELKFMMLKSEMGHHFIKITRMKKF
jgi:galactokinase